MELPVPADDQGRLNVHKSRLTPEQDKLAQDILILTRDNLLVALRFLAIALCQFELVMATGCSSVSGGTLATDGRHLFYDIRHVLRRYQDSHEQVNRDYLHLVLHCIFYHPFTGQNHTAELWDLACDMAVENIMTELGLRQTACASDHEQRPVLHDLKKEVKILTAERIYRHLQEKAYPEERLEHFRKLFQRDHHELWYQKPDQPGDDENLEGQGPASPQLFQERWQEISERIQVDLDTVSRQWADRSGALTQNISTANREHYDYQRFLNRFMVLGESMQINDDEFDYVYYTYGLNLYRNMPLVEPLEYKEVKKIRDFVIAIDTSGSCSGELVQAFIARTCAIFRQSENFFQKFNVHIVQCDARIQSAVKITNLEDFEHYIRQARLQGFGGTDFRPVFAYVDDLIAKKEFVNLKGLIYFTDGYGTMRPLSCFSTMTTAIHRSLAGRSSCC
jgi:predicted metal-dependent peptidase